ncbi:MAG: hypothetical protein GY832_17430 [Chloroflexi bacterium]|nr:hypothetical protein [Chloroflexota bacterium]
MTPTETISTYLRQSRRRWVMFATACAVGLAVAVPVTLWSDITYPGWRIFLLVHGIIFWPWFLKQAFGKKQVSVLEATRAAKEKRG